MCVSLTFNPRVVLLLLLLLLLLRLLSSLLRFLTSTTRTRPYHPHPPLVRLTYLVPQAACETTTEENRTKSATNTVSSAPPTRRLGEGGREVDERSKAERGDATVR